MFQEKADIVTFRVSHLLHGSRSNHDRHGDLETQDGCCHINLAHINQNPRPEAVYTSQGMYIRFTPLAKPITKSVVLYLGRKKKLTGS